MPRKKRTVPPKQAVSDVPELPSLTQEEVLRLRLFLAEAKIAETEGKALRLEREAYLNRVDPQRRLHAFDVQLAMCNDREVGAKKAQAELLQKVGERLKLDITTGYTIEPESGQLVQHEKKE